MTNEQFLFKYLDRNFYLEVKEKRLVFVDKVTGSAYDTEYFLIHIGKVFGRGFYDSHIQWIDKAKRKFADGFFEYLDKCCVIRTKTGWEAFNNNGKIIADNVKYKKFKKKYGPEITDAICDEWLTNKKIEATEKLMGVV